MTPIILQKRELALSAAFLLVLGTTAFLGHVIGLQQGDDATHGAALSMTASTHKNTVTAAERRAERVLARLERETGHGYSLQTVEDSLERRAQLLNRSVAVQVKDATAGKTAEWTFEMSKFPWLLEVKPEFGRPMFRVNEEAFERALHEGVFEGSNPVRDSYVTGFKQDGAVVRAETNGVARSGFDYADKDMQAILDGLLATESGSVTLDVPYRDGHLYVEENGERTELTLLAYGRSEFSDSPEGRIKNVHKAIDQQVNNTVVERDAIFSFNDTLGGPVTLDKGWVEALGLFGGGAAMTPGGGICQAATTVYRAAVLAGMPIVYRRNHSLYVSHYEQFGVGIDATIFPGFHDLTFRNNTPGRIVLQSYIEGEDVYVSIYGVPDGRTVRLEGPYFATTRPRAPELRPLGYNDIGWVRHITYADGTEESTPLISHYAKPVPRNLARTYLPVAEADILHAAAPQPAL